MLVIDIFRVDALLRKQTALERDMSAIHQKLIAHDKDAQSILAKVVLSALCTSISSPLFPISLTPNFVSNQLML